MGNIMPFISHSPFAAVMAVLAPDNIPLDLCFQVGATEREEQKSDFNGF